MFTVKYDKSNNRSTQKVLPKILPLTTGNSVKRSKASQITNGLKVFWAGLKKVWPGGQRGPVGNVPVGPDNPLPPLTIAISTRNRPQDVEKVVRSILETGYPQFEILLIDQSDEDSGQTEVIFRQLSSEAASDSKKFNYFKSPTVGLGFAHNLKMREARYELVAFTDDDCRVDREWPFAIARLFSEQPQLAMIIGAVEPGPHNQDTHFVPVFKNFKEGPATLYHFKTVGASGMGANFALTKTAYRLIGPFDNALGSGSVLKSAVDTDYFYRTWRRGQLTLYRPDCLVWHDGLRQNSAAVDQQCRSNFGVAALFTKNLRCGDLVALVCLWGWLKTHLEGAIAQTELRKQKGEPPYELYNLIAICQGVLASFTLPINRRTRTYRVDNTRIESWHDDKVATDSA